jgi:hypothetical protein
VLQGYYRAWRISAAAEVPPLDVRVRRLAVAAYRDTHRALPGARRNNAARAA